MTYASYVKEPISGAFCAFALINLLFRAKSSTQKGFYIAIIVNFIAYLALYYFLVYRTSDYFYNSGRCSLSHFSNMLQEEKDRLNSHLVRNNFAETFQRSGLSIYERNRLEKEREQKDAIQEQNI